MSTTIVYEDVRKFRVLPLREVTIVMKRGLPEHYTFTLRNLKPDSDWDLSPITRKTSRGVLKEVAYKFSASFVCVQNNLNEFSTLKQELNAGEIAFVMMRMSNSNLYFGPPAGERITTTLPMGGIIANAMKGTFNERQNGKEPQISVNVEGIFSVDIVDVAYHTTYFESINWEEPI